jgi:hypothetical protein
LGLPAPAARLEHYRADEFAPAGEPPDVLFRDASFEVFFVLDEGRRLNDEWRDELQRRRSAFSLSQLVRREAKPRRIPANEFLLRLAPTLRKKAHNYKNAAWIWANWTSSPSPASSAKCWTSTAISAAHRIPAPGLALAVAGRADFARVLFAHPDAPDFLRSNLGRSIVFDVGISL